MAVTRQKNKPPAHMHVGAGVEAPWASGAEAVLQNLQVNPDTGLDAQAVAERRSRHGMNLLRGPVRRHVLAILAEQVKSLVVLLLVAASALAFAFSDFAEGIAILVVIAINTTIGFLTEWRATRSMEALGRLGRVETVVLRDAVVKTIPAEELVPGDIVIREAGDVVTADMRLIEAAKLQADESTLTGESMPVSKSIETLATDTPLVDRRNMLFKGTAVTRGSCKAIVTSVGFGTELGRISELVTTAEAQETPLEKRLDSLANVLVWTVLALAAVIAVAGIVVGRGTVLAIEVAIALGVASIPEGLPIVATIALARGMYRMAKKNALIARLSAVETLGATSIILSDKTGTLTENRMTVTTVHLASGSLNINPASDRRLATQEDDTPTEASKLPLLDTLLESAVRCSNASIHVDRDGTRHVVGDPTEVALLNAAELRNIHRDDLLKRNPEIMEFAFDPETKLMATLHKSEADTLHDIKGAPESVLPLCKEVLTEAGPKALTDVARDEWVAAVNELGARGLRTLAVARKTSATADAEPYSDLTLLGVVGLEDPPRAGVKEAIEACHNAGIRVLMVTGDHAATARNIAAEVGITVSAAANDDAIDGPEIDQLLASENSQRLLEARVFSRVAPEQKLKLIDFFQRHRHVVAMTGDGVNDAPALKKADIGVAMGIRGTAVAREAAAMVLQDDEFGTIVRAVSQGRAIFQNIRKFVVYLLSCNISEVLIVTIATLAGAPLPLLPLQVLFLNLVTDVFPALALGVGEGSPMLMKDKPRPFDEPILARRHWLRIFLHGFVIAAVVLAAMSIAIFQLGMSSEDAVTVSFTTLALAQVWHVFNMRDQIHLLVKNEITRNPWIWLAIATCLALVAAAVYLPILRELLQLTDPGRQGWLLILGMSFIPLLIAPVVRVATGTKA